MHFTKIIWMILVLMVIVSLQTTSCLEAQSTKRKEDTIKWDKSAFTVRTISSAASEATWLIRVNGDLDAPVDESISSDKADGVLEAFKKLPYSKKSRGIFVYSKTYAIPDTLEERRFMTEYIYSLYKDAKWRESESTLIEEVRKLCEAQNIPLYVNLSANLNGEWKKLAPSEKALPKD